MGRDPQGIQPEKRPRVDAWLSGLACEAVVRRPTSIPWAEELMLAHRLGRAGGDMHCCCGNDGDVQRLTPQCPARPPYRTLTPAVPSTRREGERERLRKRGRKEREETKIGNEKAKNQPRAVPSYRRMIDKRRKR